MVNLLSWRADLRKQKKRQFWQALVITILIVIIVVFIWYLILEYQLSGKRHDNNNIKQQIAALNSKYIKAKKIQQQEHHLLKQTKDLQLLKNNSRKAILLFKELATIVPKATHLIELYKQDNSLILIGESQLDIGIVEFMENVKQSRLFNNPILQKVKSHNINHRWFILKCRLN
jgi:type IV pilus assembly protein PilN